ncbi:MAG: hypothetical protein GF368_04305 [Candidatus Aenigmarchaeota archaeon]|nr:hypothetical protein [Candidatus Aenigmarchaeota archaeon]
MVKTRLIIHPDILEEDMKGNRGGDPSRYQRVLRYISQKGGVLVYSTVPPEVVASMFNPGDTVIMEGCYGEPGACIDEYTEPLTKKGVIVIRDNKRIIY